MTQATAAPPEEWAGLMQAAQAGDRAAYAALLRAVTPHVRAMARAALRDRAEAEDAVQDILLTLHETRRMYDPTRPFRPWLVGIARRRLIDRLRARGRRAARETPLGPEHETFAIAAANDAQGLDDAPALRAALALLPDGQRVAVELLKLQEMSLKQASGVTGMSVGALKVATHRAIRRLRAALRPPGVAE